MIRVIQRNDLGNCEDSAQDDAKIDKIISKYGSHPSVQKIKREFSIDKKFELDYASAKDINHMIKFLNINKAKVQMESLLSSLKFRPILLIVILQI